MNNELREMELNNVAKVLAGLGISIIDNDGNYRPFNEVFIDLGKAFKELRKNIILT